MERRWRVTCAKWGNEGDWNAFKAILSDPWYATWMSYGRTREEAIQKVCAQVRSVDPSEIEGVAA